MIRLLTATALVAALLFAAPTASAEDVTAIKNVKIVTVSGKTIEKATLLIANGKIAEFGTDVKVPWGAKVVNGAGKVLIPGMVVAHTYSGTDSPNENVPITPYVSTVDSIDPSHIFFEGQLREGVTALGIFPGNSAPIPGRGIAVKIRTRSVHGMLAKRDLALKISMSTGRGSAMQTMAQIKKAFDDAKKAVETLEEAKKKAAEAKKAGKKVADPKPISFKIQPLLDAMNGKLDVLISCASPGDVLRAIELIGAYKLAATLSLRGSAFRAHAAIAKAKLKVILGPGVTWTQIDPETTRETITPIAGRMAKAKVPFALSPAHRTLTIASGHLWYQAATAIRWGLSEADALRAITLTPAEILGLDKQIGSIEKGKDADLVLLSGEPFRVRTFTERVWVDGKEVYRRDKDKWLDRLYYKKSTNE